MTGPQTSAGFRVEPGAAAQAITELEDAMRELTAIKRTAMSLGKVTAPSRDPVSIEAAEVLGRSAVGEKGSLVQALDEGIVRMQAIVDDLRASLAAYREGDDRAATDLS